MLRKFKLGLAIAALATGASVSAQDDKVPYWASIRAEVVNMRVGPGTSYNIDWVYRRIDLPLRVIRRDEGWRLVEDPDGARGWMLGRFLSLERTAIVQGEGLAEMRLEASPASRLLWRLEPGVIVKLDECQAGWCGIEINNRKGFIRDNRLWGDGAP